jgi:hypothetical protein
VLDGVQGGDTAAGEEAAAAAEEEEEDDEKVVDLVTTLGLAGVCTRWKEAWEQAKQARLGQLKQVSAPPCRVLLGGRFG